MAVSVRIILISVLNNIICIQNILRTVTALYGWAGQVTPMEVGLPTSLSIFFLVVVAGNWMHFGHALKLRGTFHDHALRELIDVLAEEFLPWRL